MEVAVCGPNIRFRHGATFEVHAVGCLDLKRGACAQDSHPMILDAATRHEIVDAVYPPDDFGCESGEFQFDFHFAPCCAMHLRLIGQV